MSHEATTDNPYTRGIAQGWHSGATLGVFSAAAGAARGKSAAKSTSRRAAKREPAPRRK